MNNTIDLVGLIKRNMLERGFKAYDTKAVLVELDANETKIIGNSDDFYMYLSANSQYPVKLLLLADNNALKVDGQMSSTLFLKHVMLRSNVQIKNTGNAKAYVEILQVTLACPNQN